MRKPLNNNGDTFVEVLIAIAVLGAVIGAAFAISNSALRATYANQERYQAQLLANGQAERLRATYENWVNNPLNSRSTFAASKPTAPAVCLDVTAVWTTAGCTINGLFNINVTDVPIAAAGSAAGTAITYSIEVTWVDFSNSKQSRVELLYGL